MEATLTLRAASGYWTPATQTAYANTPLNIKLNTNGLIRQKAVLFFNGVAFLFGGGGEVTVPADLLREVNCCRLEERDGDGKTVKEWKNIETLHFDLVKLDKTGEAEMLAEREFFAGIKRDFDALKNEMTEFQGALSKAFMELQGAYRTEAAAKQKLAAEIVRQAEVIAEMKKDVEALKNEPII